MTDRRTGRARVAGVFLVASMATTGTLLGAGTAAADTQACGCGSSTNAQVGDRMAADASTVAPLVEQGATEAKQSILLGINTVNPSRLAETVRSEGTIDARTGVANQQRTGASGANVATTVVQLLRQSDDGLGANEDTKNTVLDKIQQKVSSGCPLSATATDYRSAPATQAPSGGGGAQPAPAPRVVVPRRTVPQQQPQQQLQQQPRTGGFAPGAGTDPLGSGIPQGRQAPRNYGNVPYARPGQYSPSPQQRYGQGVPGYAPAFGQVPDKAGQRAQRDPVRSAGQAEAMQARRTGAEIGLPMLLAVVALAGVSAALVRTWVQRKAAA